MITITDSVSIFVDELQTLQEVIASQEKSSSMFVSIGNEIKESHGRKLVSVTLTFHYLFDVAYLFQELGRRLEVKKQQSRQAVTV